LTIITIRVKGRLFDSSELA